MSENQISNPTAKPCVPSPAKKYHDYNDSKELPAVAENSRMINQSISQSNDQPSSDNEFSYQNDLSDDYDIGAPGLGTNYFESSVDVNEEITIFSEEDGGGGRNGGRATMGDVMRLNEQNGGDDPLRNQFNIDNGNDYNFGDNNDPNDNNNNNNNLYEDNMNFGDGGLQIVVNGNDTNFFV